MTSYIENMSVRYRNFTEGADPIIDSWTLMRSPIPVLSIAALYLLFVLRVGPQWMEQRKPFELKKLLIVYNASQVIVSTWFCVQAIVLGGKSRLLMISCNSSSPLSKDFQLTVWEGAWWYLMLKLVELLDTVFFVLRKKQNQVSFLHVYHHTIMLVFTWAYLKYLPGVQGAFIGVLNSFVHIIMYSYYLIAALGPQYQKYLWWKKYMTTLQLLQFGIMLCYLLALNSMQCNVPRPVTYFFVTNVTIFLFLFINFYCKAYRNRPSGKKLM